MRWSWQEAKVGFLGGLLGGLVFVLVFGFFLGFMNIVLFSVSGSLVLGSMTNLIFWVVRVGLGVGMIGGLIGGLVFGLGLAD